MEVASDDDGEAARLAAQGLVTWVNYPTLAHSARIEREPSITVNGRSEPLDAMLDVSSEVRADGSGSKAKCCETLPARNGLARVRVPPGEHRIVLSARGHERDGKVKVAGGGWKAVSLLALR